MKLAPILAQYLSTNKQLALPGIGVFQSVPSAHVELSKNSKLPVDDISFVNNPATKNEEDLIKFISEKTGKMKALAISDFESYLELMQQFLNIGKPFQLEGIGTLVRIKPGVYEFTSGHALNEKIGEPAVKEPASTADSFGSYKTYPKHSTAGVTFKKTFVAFLLFGGIAFAIWGGYSLYDKNKSGSQTETVQEKAVAPVVDTATTAPVQKTVALKTDTVIAAKPHAAPGYKFVFETTINKKRAIKRFNFLKTINSDIHLETASDSSSFNITVNLIIPASDTTRVKDSLNNWYYGKKDMLVKIASPNVSANVP